MRRVPRLPRTVRRVIHRIATSSAASPPRPPRRERASLAFPNCPTNAASRPPTAKQCGELLRLSRTVQTNAASRPPTAAQGTSSHSFPNQYGEFPELSNQCGESSPDRQAMRRASPAFPNCPTNAASRPGLYQPVRRVILLPPLRERVPTASPPNAASSPASPNSAASYPSDCHIQCGESSPDRQAMRRASPAFPNCPTNAASYSPKVTQFAELCSEQKQHSTHHR